MIVSKEVAMAVSNLRLKHLIISRNHLKTTAVVTPNSITWPDCIETKYNPIDSWKFHWNGEHNEAEVLFLVFPKIPLRINITAIHEVKFPRLSTKKI